MNYYLGIDGGGTKTKFLLCRENLDTVAETTLGSCHYLQIGLDGLENMLANGILSICQGAKIEPSDIKHAFLGCPGFNDIIEDIPKITSSVSRAMKNIPFHMGNDCENALAGALNRKPGINIIAGTGSVGYGIDDFGKSAHSGGWHHAIGGDNGSAYWISYQLLSEFQRQSDGRDPKTPLYQNIVKKLDLTTDDQLVTKVVVEWNMDRAKIASLSPICSELCQQGDPYALDIMKRCAAELADYAIAIKSQLNFKGSVPVSGTGGVFKAGKILTDEYNSILLQNGMYYQEALYTPDIGSVLLAIHYAN